MSNKELLTIEEIAELTRCTVRHARDAVVRLQGFPKEAPVSTPRNRLWVAREVIAFATRENYSQTTQS